MALCGAGCMGFVNVAYGLRAVGYVEPDPLPAGPVALITHSGSVFSALLRSRRELGYTLAVSSGQELVTPAAAYARYALSLPQTRVLGLVLEAVREPALLRQVLAAASTADIPVVLLTAGSSAAGRAMVAAHSGALAGQDGSWEALADAYGVHRVGDFAEMADTLELFAIGRRAAAAARTATAGTATAGTATGIATVHDSGLERAHIADLADELGVPFAAIGDATKNRLAAVLDPGLEPANPLDMWGGSREAERQLTESLAALADDPAVAAVALAVDLLTEFDGDRSYPLAVNAAALRTGKPLMVLANIPAAVDPAAAAWLRQAGDPRARKQRAAACWRCATCSTTRPARCARARTRAAHRRDAVPVRTSRAPPRLRAAPGRGSLAQGDAPDGPVAGSRTCSAPTGSRPPGPARPAPPTARWRRRPRSGTRWCSRPASPASPTSRTRAGSCSAWRSGRARRRRTGTWPAGSVRGCSSARPPAPAPSSPSASPATPASGRWWWSAPGGLLVEFLADRAVALPPVDAAQALCMLRRLRVAGLLAGVRGQPPRTPPPSPGRSSAVSAIARELGDQLEALDINPLICGPAGAVAVDVLAVPRGENSGRVVEDQAEGEPLAGADHRHAVPDGRGRPAARGPDRPVAGGEDQPVAVRDERRGARGTGPGAAARTAGTRRRCGRRRDRSG